MVSQGNSANLPAPFGGIDQSIPKAALKSPFCEDLFNFNTNQIGISLRKGDSYYTNINPAGLVSTKRIYNYGDQKGFLAVFNNSVLPGEIDFYDIDSGGVVFSSSSGGTDDFHTLYFNKYLFFFGESVYIPGYFYNAIGGVFGSIGYTNAGTPSVTFNPVGGDVYNHRAYMIQKTSASYWYSGIDEVSGSCTNINLAGIIQNYGELFVIAPITISDNISAITFQAFVFNSGEVLFYSGDYPDADNWAMIGRAQIGHPLNYNSGFQYQGDYYIICDNGLFSLRDLFLKGSEDAASLTVNSRVQGTWTALVNAMRTFYSYTTLNRILGIHGVWDTKGNRLIISFPGYLNASNVFNLGSFYFVFDTINKSWNFQRSFGIGTGKSIIDIITYRNNVLILADVASGHGIVYLKEGATGFTDRSNANGSVQNTYDYEFLSAPVPFAKTADYEASQIEPIMQSDLYAQTNWQFVADFGKQSTDNQPLVDQGAFVAKPAVNIGIQNITYVQVKMSGSTTSGKTIGLDLYSYNVWYSSGETGSR